jgi:hypothetical protein
VQPRSAGSGNVQFAGEHNSTLAATCTSISFSCLECGIPQGLHCMACMHGCICCMRPASCPGRTSHCFALKNVEGPTGGPSAGGTTMRRLPPGFMPLMPNSMPAAHSTASHSMMLHSSSTAWHGMALLTSGPLTQLSTANKTRLSLSTQQTPPPAPRTAQHCTASSGTWRCSLLRNCER